MKNLFIFALIAAVIGSTTATTAKADKEGRALIGGLIGGLIIGSALNDNAHHRHSRVSVQYGSGYGHSRGGHYNNCSCSGHYDHVSVRNWISGGYSVHYDNCGRSYRTWRPGRYAYSNRRVWVPHNRGCRLYSSPGHGYRGDDYREDHRRHR